jgi:putative ABC transport system substrate-binding protein
VAVVWNPNHADPEYRELQKVAQPVKISLQSLDVRRAEDFPAQFHAASSAKAQALIVVSSRLINLHRRGILDHAAKARVPLVGDWGPWVDEGALMSYGPTTAEMARRVVVYLDKILKGAVPAGLPVERPTKFEFALNLKIAKALNLTIPQSVLYRADRVIK